MRLSVEEIELRKSTYPHIGISQNSPIQSPSRMLSFAAEVQMRGGSWATVMVPDVPLGKSG